MNDLISRQAAIDAVKSDLIQIDPLDPDQGIMKACIRRAVWRLKQVQVTDVQPVVRGDWEEVEVTWLADVEDQPDAIASMHCPECRRYANHVYHYGNPRYGMNFCPWCGARMGGDAE